MKCEELSPVLIDYTYDELGPSEAREVTEHLASCADCALEFCQLRADLALAVPMPEGPGARVKAALRRRVERELAPPLWRRLRAAATRPVPAFALALAAMIPLGIWAGATWSPPNDDAPPPAVLSDFDGARVWTDPDLL